MSQLRPIALCNVSYKIISKIITQHLQAFMPYVISSNQCSFISGRSLVDNILLCKRLFILCVTCMVREVIWL